MTAALRLRRREHLRRKAHSLEQGELQELLLVEVVGM